MISSRKEIPDYPYYVTMTDKFMSGWGHAEGKTSKLLVPCASHAEAEIAEDNARGRSEMCYVSIRSSKPTLRSDQVWSVVERSTDAPFYTPGYWGTLSEREYRLCPECDTWQRSYRFTVPYGKLGGLKFLRTCKACHARIVSEAAAGLDEVKRALWGMTY